MKTVKPQRLGLLTYTFENDGKAYFVITAMAYFGFDDPDTLLHEAALWTMVVEELGTDTPFDAGMTKSRGEVLVTGKAYAPAGGTAKVRSVKLSAQRGTRTLIDKELYVIGDRHWERTGPSEPVPFSEMPITWNRAFGGEGFEWNPVGRGFAPTKEEDGREIHRMPNVEDPKRLITSKAHKPEAVGFGPLDVAWPQRMKKAGTYDDVWLKTRFPGLAADIDWTFYNVAPENQQFDGFFTGEETFELHGMHPTRNPWKVRLPNVVPRLFIVQEGGIPDSEEDDLFREATARLDTVWLFPNKGQGVAIFRGVLEIKEDDAADVLHIVVGFERPGEVRPRSHYRRVLELRKDKKRGAIHALDDKDLMPEPREGQPTKPSDEDWNDMVAVAKTEGLMQKRLEVKADKKIKAAREELVAAGLDPKKFDEQVNKPREQPPKDSSELAALFDRAEKEAEAAKKQGDATMADLEKQARESLAAIGVDYDAKVAEGKQGQGGPPTFSAKREMEWVKELATLCRNAGNPNAQAEAKLADPNYMAVLEDAERKLFEAYRKQTHVFPPAKEQDPSASAAIRADILAIRSRGESLAGRDLTGVDLSGIDLSGADLRQALLEKAVLKGANLRGADLTEATLSRANLSDANLSGAKLAGANLGLTILRGTRLDGGIDFTGALFYQTDFTDANLQNATLVSTQFLESTLEGTDFSGAKLDKALFLQAKLIGAKFSSAALVEAIFLEATLDSAKFGGANLTDATFVKTKGQAVSFVGATLHGARVVLECAFPGGDFRGARFRRTCMRNVNLAGADFRKAEMPEVDLSECDLTGAKLEGVMLDGSMLMRTNLSGAEMSAASLKMAILQKAKLHDTDLRGANLFRSDLAKVKLNAKTNVKGALLTEARVVQENRKREGNT